MTGKVSATLFGLLVCTLPAFALQPQPQSAPAQTASAARTAEQWARQLEYELDHLEEDLYYERGTYPGGLREQVDRTSRAAAHFRQILRRNPGHAQLMSSFHEMDQHVHQLVQHLEQSGDAWLRRQASRIRYPDEQLHYVLQSMAPAPNPAQRDLITRHARVLSREASNLQELVDRVARRDDAMRGVVAEFAATAEHFQQASAGGANLQHLSNDFREVDETWQVVVDQINRSPYGLYLRRNAQNVNRVQNQIHTLLTTEPGAAPPQTVAPQPAQPPQQAAPARSRPAIEVEIPGLGRVRIPR